MELGGELWKARSSLMSSPECCFIPSNSNIIASGLPRQPSSATGLVGHFQDKLRRLGQNGLNARKPVACVPLTATHCRLRLAWSREHALWAYVMFSDESMFILQSDYLRTFIWRAPGTCYH
ncbi:HTH_Tnp_Tc3_2 domain-containing protein [Trichonephila clavipes]|nr:HTH_Tnp_Tc3_2 domain-containing protein [Trichonephila clavipes]